MGDAARKLEDEVTIGVLATVLRSEGDGVVVRTRTAEIRARRATSCLLEPVAGDQVLLASAGRDLVWVLAVLDRTAGQGATMKLDGDLTIELGSGAFVVAAQEGLRLLTGKAASLIAATIDVNAVEGRASIERVSLVGDAVVAELGKLKLLASSVESTLERLVSRVKRSYRRVDELDQLRAERIDYAAKKNMSLRAGNAVITAEELCKIDAEQIHVG